MKSIFCVAIVLTIFVTQSFGAIGRANLTDPRYPGKCVVNDEFMMDPGTEAKHPEECARIMCYADGMAEFQTCPTSQIEGCKQGDYIDVNLPYPDCCKRELICK